MIRLEVKAMYVGDKWAWIQRDRRGEEWLIVDGKCVAQVVYSGGSFTYYDEIGNKHKAKSFRTMVKNAVQIYNVNSARSGRSKVLL